jgi:hypothetical protein
LVGYVVKRAENCSFFPLERNIGVWAAYGIYRADNQQEEKWQLPT